MAVTRKQISIAIASFLLVSLALLVASNHSGVSRHIITTTSFNNASISRPTTSSITTTSASDAPNVCSKARLNPHHVQAPLDPDIGALTSFWPELKTALVDHGTDLPTINRPHFQSSRPTLEAIRARTDLLTPEEALLVRKRHAAFVADIPAYPSNTFGGRGIVMLAGGHYSEYAATALGVLRESGSTLPVEVWRRDEREEKHEWCDEIEAEGMACRRLSDYLDTDILAIQDGKEMKIFTMLFSNFEEIVFIDADNMALQPPELLFDSMEYRETGAVLWPDFRRYDNVDWLDYIVGLAPDRSEALWEQTTAESGQIVWDKQRHWKALLLATYYNYYGPDLYYTLLNCGYAGWGDKDTFPLALRALEEPFFTVPHAPESAWVSERVDDRRVGMLQMAPPSISPSSRGKDAAHEGQGDGEAASAFFLHATTIKWSHRDFLCLECLPIWYTDAPSDPFFSRYESVGDELYGRLHGNLPIMDDGALGQYYMPADNNGSARAAATGAVEVRIWRAMEFAACRSRAWRHARACDVGRRYMQATFGFTFASGSAGVEEEVDWIPGMEAEACLIDPS
ncbi:hypothetical protein LTR36_001734 [Oleoguttula mirabilis]|uniref:Alpha-1,2-mannosyltransferase n=1 Tax=Oleoguttula mirabilis TaxID=1507867 RepID=A0AAV9JMJ4_9PEZI|nr:hypothetical protein LTR36_001734 [Oleoguttula mirabilis]